MYIHYVAKWGSITYEHDHHGNLRYLLSETVLTQQEWSNLNSTLDKLATKAKVFDISLSAVFDILSS